MLTAVVTIVIFLVLITLHEFGHFITAKLTGIKVLEFAIGMGPAIFKKQTSETLYSVRIFPIGGYCRMEGEDEKTDDARAFCNQRLWKRFLVVAAGGILNVLLGFVLFLVLVSGQDTIQKPIIEAVDDRSNLAEVGVLPGDKILEINGNTIHFYKDIAFYTSELYENTNVNLVVSRNGEKKSFGVQPVKREVTNLFLEDGVHVTDVMDGVERTLVVEYGPEGPAKYGASFGEEWKSTGMVLGLSPQSEEKNTFNVITEAYHNTGFVVRLVYHAILDMFTGKAGIEQMSGPIGIVSVVDEAVKSGSEWVMSVLSIMALLTINLGVFNLLPLPALDGGRIFFMLIELIFRRPVPPEKEGLVHTIGLLLLLLLAVVIAWNDIMKLVGA